MPGKVPGMWSAGIFQCQKLLVSKSIPNTCMTFPQLCAEHCKQGMMPGIPYRVEYSARCGRLLVAGRSFLAGEVIFSDQAACVGPDNNPRPVCLVCYTRLRRVVVRCAGCGWPLCSEKCRDMVGLHARECSMFQQYNTQ